VEIKMGSSAEDIRKRVEPEDGSLHFMFKNSTKDLHEQAEKSVFMNAVIRRRLSLQAYKIFLANLYYLYDAMEEAMRQHADDPILGPVSFPDELNRKDALASDLEYYYGPEWKNIIQCASSVTEYINYIRMIMQEQPGYVIPHAYARYLGDLSGGQIIKYQILKAYSLNEDNKGLQFFQFPNVSDVNSFKKFYSARLNSLEVTPEQRDRLVLEARRAFEYNIKLFNQMDLITKSLENGYLPDPKEEVKNGHVSNGVSHKATDALASPVKRQTSQDAHKLSKVAIAYLLFFVVMLAFLLFCPWCNKMIRSGLQTVF
jgi:heme oxygenase